MTGFAARADLARYQTLTYSELNFSFLFGPPCTETPQLKEKKNKI